MKRALGFCFVCVALIRTGVWMQQEGVNLRAVLLDTVILLVLLLGVQ